MDVTSASREFAREWVPISVCGFICGLACFRLARVRDLEPSDIRDSQFLPQVLCITVPLRRVGVAVPGLRAAFVAGTRWRLPLDLIAVAQSSRLRLIKAPDGAQSSPSDFAFRSLTVLGNIRSLLRDIRMVGITSYTE